MLHNIVMVVVSVVSVGAMAWAMVKLWNTRPVPKDTVMFLEERKKEEKK